MFKKSRLIESVAAAGDEVTIKPKGQNLIVSGVSVLSANKISRQGSFTNYQKPSSTTLRPANSDSRPYFIPKELDPDTQKAYKQTLDRIFEIYRNMLEAVQVNPDFKNGSYRTELHMAAKLVWPLALKTEIEMPKSKSLLEDLVVGLLSDELPEIWQIGQLLLQTSRQTLPGFMEGGHKPEQMATLVAHKSTTYKNVKKLANKHLTGNHADGGKTVTLTDYWPRNELDLLTDMMYPHSNSSRADLSRAINGWPMERKEELFRAYLGEQTSPGHKLGPALEKAHYQWDLVTDYQSFGELLSYVLGEAGQQQLLTPRFGYDVPSVIEKAGLAEQFEDCFDLSIELYSQLQASGYILEAQYATLQGHKLRWQTTLNATQVIHFIQEGSKSDLPGYGQLSSHLYKALAEVHPLLTETLHLPES